MSAASEGHSTLDVAHVIREAFALVRRNFPVLLILAVILIGLPSLARGAVGMRFFAGGRTPLFEIASYIVQVAASGLYQAAVIHRTVAGLQGRRATVAECLGVVVRLIGPLLAIEIFYVIACVAGGFLLLVPGLMMMVAWYVTVGAYVVERPGLLGSFRRSAELTRGHRWPIFGLLALELVVLLLLSWASTLVFTIAPAVLGFPAPQATYYFAVAPLYYLVSGLISSGLRAALYIELRQIRDGVGLRGVAAIFD